MPYASQPSLPLLLDNTFLRLGGVEMAFTVFTSSLNSGHNRSFHEHVKSQIKRMPPSPTPDSASRRRAATCGRAVRATRGTLSSSTGPRPGERPQPPSPPPATSSGIGNLSKLLKKQQYTRTWCNEGVDGYQNILGHCYVSLSSWVNSVNIKFPLILYKQNCVYFPSAKSVLLKL